MTSCGYPWAKAVVAMDNYLLQITFENGEVRVFDAKPMLKGMEGKWLGELLNVSYFKQVFVNDGVVQWPDEQDICPDCVYEDSIPVFENMSENGIEFVKAM